MSLTYDRNSCDILAKYLKYAHIVTHLLASVSLVFSLISKIIYLESKNGNNTDLVSSIIYMFIWEEVLVFLSLGRKETYFQRTKKHFKFCNTKNIQIESTNNLNSQCTDKYKLETGTLKIHDNT